MNLKLYQYDEDAEGYYGLSDIHWHFRLDNPSLQQRNTLNDLINPIALSFTSPAIIRNISRLQPYRFESSEKVYIGGFAGKDENLILEVALGIAKILGVELDIL